MVAHHAAVMLWRIIYEPSIDLIIAYLKCMFVLAVIPASLLLTCKLVNQGV